MSIFTEEEKEALERIEQWIKRILRKIDNGEELTREEKILWNMLVEINKKNYLSPYEY